MLKNSSQLHSFSLKSANLSNIGGLTMVSSLKEIKLTHIDLRNTPMDETALNALVKHTKNHPTLKRISLDIHKLNNDLPVELL